MINVAELIHDPDFEQTVTLERTRDGHFVGNQYVSTKTLITLYGVVVQPSNSKEINQTREGDQATGYTTIYVDDENELFVTRQRVSGDNISDVYIENPGTEFETRYRITNVYNRPRWGYYKAVAVREGAM